MSRARRVALVVLGPALLAAASLAVAAAGDDAVVLHEDFAAGLAGADGAGAPGLVGAAEAGQNPAAFAAGEKLLPEPEAPSPGDDPLPIFGAGGFATDRHTEHTPNDDTGSDGTLHYVEVFNPSIVPFKRMSSLDAVRPDQTLITTPTGRRDVPVGGAPRPGSDRFWGSMQVRLEPGVDVAIPSVAADMRILSYETTPRTALTFSRDGADNYFVRSDESGVAGVHALVFLAEADPRYFVPEVPTRAPVSRLDAGRVRPLPPAIATVARRALRTLRLDRSSRIDVALNTLVAYFRGFQPGEPPPSTGDLYWDLFESKRGVCRHRAFAFMITANALGIPARFLGNEAHAWVEVHLPGGWARIDLGGAAAELDVTGAADKTMYQPDGEDPFARPREYTENYTRLTGDVQGLTADQLAEARTPRPGAGAGGGRGAGAADRAGGGAAGGADGDAPARDGAATGVDPSAGPAPGGGAAAVDGAAGGAVASGLPVADPTLAATKQPTRVRVERASPGGFRGEAIEVAGAVAASGRGLPAMRIDLYLARVGEGGAGARLVGHTVSDEAGRFRAELVLPRDLDLARYEVFAATPGDATFAASVSD